MNRRSFLSRLLVAPAAAAIVVKTLADADVAEVPFTTAHPAALLLRLDEAGRLTGKRPSALIHYYYTDSDIDAAGLDERLGRAFGPMGLAKP